MFDDKPFERLQEVAEEQPEVLIYIFNIDPGVHIRQGRLLYFVRYR